MKGAICYALFGYERERHADCFDFNSYLRGLMINIRMNRLLFPDWDIIVQTDKATYEGWQHLLERLPIKLEVHQDKVPLTLAMLWRLRPAFDQSYTHILCRDLDSPPTYRERQAVEYWINKDKAAHAITDSVSHDVPMLGGMIGFRPQYFMDKVGVRSWGDLIRIQPNYDWSRKGSDQTFLTDIIMPCFGQQGLDSITQHYFKGRESYLSDVRKCICPSMVGHESYCPNNIEVNLPIEYKESNSVCGHIGSAGFYSPILERFLHKYRDKFLDLYEIEKDYEDTFYWNKEHMF